MMLRYTFGGVLNCRANSALSTEGTVAINLTEFGLVESEHIPCNVYKDGLHFASDIDEWNGGRLWVGAKTLLGFGVYIPRPRLSNMHWYRGQSQALTSSNSNRARWMCINGRFSARNSCFDLYVGLICSAISPALL